MVNLGQLYASTLGASADQCVPWLARAALVGSPDALFLLGVYYQRVDKKRLAFLSHELGALAGHAASM